MENIKDKLDKLASRVRENEAAIKGLLTALKTQQESINLLNESIQLFIQLLKNTQNDNRKKKT